MSKNQKFLLIGLGLAAVAVYLYKKNKSAVPANKSVKGETVVVGTKVPNGGIKANSLANAK